MTSPVPLVTEATLPYPAPTAAIEAAVAAYDYMRCRLNEHWHGGKCEPMSETNRANIWPMISAALTAAAPAIRRAALLEARNAVGQAAWKFEGHDAHSRGMDAGAVRQVQECVMAIDALFGPIPAPPSGSAQ